MQVNSIIYIVTEEGVEETLEPNEFLLAVDSLKIKCIASINADTI